MNEPIATHTVAEAMVWRNGFANGERAERERIIKLLEEEYTWFTSIEAGKLYNPIPEIVALIKGENE